MMFGSAASLPGAVPKAPLSPVGAPGTGRVEPRCAGAAPPQIVSLHKAAGDLPGRPVLVVENDALAALSIQQLVRACGYRVVGPAASADEARRLLERGHRPIHCALLGASVPDAAAIADTLSARDVPVVWIVAGESDAFWWERGDEPVLRQPVARHQLLDAIERATGKVAARGRYAVPPPQPVWPRVFPQL